MTTINKITVLGSGVMGHGIAQVAATVGYNIVLRDIEQSFLDNAMKKIQWSLGKMVEKQKVSQSDADSIYGRITPVVDLKEALKGTDLLVEAVPEDMELKKKVYAEVDMYAEDKTVYASNTSTLPIGEMASLTSRPSRFIGLHFFNPPQLMPLVEVIPGHLTSSEMVNLSLDLIRNIGKEPVLCKKDVVGFIVNRIFIPLIHEAAYCLDRDKAEMTQIDSAVKFKMAFPMGIFELADYTGLDVVFKASKEMISRDKKVINPHPLIKRLYSEKKLGQKSGSGFYNYGSDNKYERVNLSEKEAEKYDPIAIVSVAANNAAWLLTNGVCDVGDLDKALRLGMGLKKPLFTIVEEFGLGKVLLTLENMSNKYGKFYEPDAYLRKIAS
ncbi:MAG: 3-hydroxyacyl-CoA dehydrogenase [Nitrososphaeraceae archaeon]|jgi:enoyl-CoA hydratase/3-hydroxyacyl-CoA dehydrogenase|nr:3-hydroxyacyl-CoA dehydrogenase [Nitrososphaeraceae archaeon]